MEYAYVVVLSSCVAVVLAGNPEELLFRRTVEQCLRSGHVGDCFAEKASRAVERALDWDVSIFEGVTLARNDEKLYNHSTARSQSSFQRLAALVSQFLDSHTVVVDLTGSGGDVETGRKDDEGYLGGDKKGKKKEKKYASYAMAVLMGIFGLTGPLIMKTLALIAGKALIASKMALLIVGSVALKKLFEKEAHHPTVKVRTEEHHREDGHDRLYNPTPYSYGNYV